ncbi:MAG: hypothetical protein CMJ94_09640 [Planctomycetes bacterium]|nr:hypothetical protein [Planctomycetota bacterium]
MSGRAAGLVLLVLCELLAGLGLRNEALAARSRAEAYHRDLLDYRRYAAHYRHLQRALDAPTAVRERLLHELIRQEIEAQPEL